MLVPMRVFFSFFSFRCSLSSPSDTGTVDPSRFIQSLVYGFFGIHVGPDEETVFISPSRDIPVATSVEVDAVTFNHHRIQVGLSPPEPSATHHHAPLPIHHPSTTHPPPTTCLPAERAAVPRAPSFHTLPMLPCPPFPAPPYTTQPTALRMSMLTTGCPGRPQLPPAQCLTERPAFRADLHECPSGEG